MSELKTTPGPWVIQTPEQIGYKPSIGTSTNLADPNYCTVCDVRGPGIEYKTPSTEGEANAHLIAAAPEMYEALQLLYIDALADLRMEESEIKGGTLLLAKTALSKARGEDS
jgi:hypothetical protein